MIAACRREGRRVGTAGGKAGQRRGRQERGSARWKLGERSGAGGGRECPRAGGRGRRWSPPPRGACGAARALPPTATRVRAREHRRCRGFPPTTASFPLREQRPCSRSFPVWQQRPCSRRLPPPPASFAVEVLPATYDREGVGCLPGHGTALPDEGFGITNSTKLPKSLKGQCYGSLDPLVDPKVDPLRDSPGPSQNVALKSLQVTIYILLKNVCSSVFPVPSPCFHFPVAAEVCWPRDSQQDLWLY